MNSQKLGTFNMQSHKINFVPYNFKIDLTTSAHTHLKKERAKYKGVVRGKLLGIGKVMVK